GSRLLLLTGGPGTGKTHAVARILGLLSDPIGTALVGASLLARAADDDVGSVASELAPTTGSNAPLRIALAAPTGKAAARLAEAVRDSGGTLPVSAQTLHRLLGLGGDGRPPRFDAAQPLPFDVVVVDEASMVDLPLMTKLAEAVPASALLVLVG